AWRDAFCPPGQGKRWVNRATTRRYNSDVGRHDLFLSRPLHLAGTRFIFFKHSLVAVAAHPEHLLKEKIVWNLNYGAAVLADDDEHEINVDHPPAKILGQHLDRVAETEGAPKGNKKTRRYIADHCPGRQKPDPDDGRGADQNGPKSANADAPDFQDQHRGNNPQCADQKTSRRQHGLVREPKPRRQLA